MINLNVVSNLFQSSKMKIAKLSTHKNTLPGKMHI